MFRTQRRINARGAWSPIVCRPNPRKIQASSGIVDLERARPGIAGQARVGQVFDVESLDGQGATFEFEDDVVARQIASVRDDEVHRLIIPLDSLIRFGR